MKKKTTEFSFVLKPAKYGIGVFATENIKRDSHLRLFGDDENIDLNRLVRKTKDVPVEFHSHCIDRGKKLLCPVDFGHMHIGWYLNHSDSPNTYPDKNYEWYASRDIKAGEEITIDYNSLDEPEEGKEYYYR